VSAPLVELVDPAYLKAQLQRLDVDLSTRLSGSEFTGRWDAGIYGWTGAAGVKILVDTEGHLQIDALSIANPPNLDVALSTRAAEATLSSFNDKFPTSIALGDVLANPTTTIIGSALLGFDGTNWERIMTDGANRLKTQLDSIPNPSNLDVALSTRLADGKVPNPLAQINRDIAGSTVYALAVIGSGSPMDLTRQPTYDELSVTTVESSISYTAPGLKLAILINRGDDDILIRINDAAGTQIKIPARCGKVIGFGGITAIYYVAVTTSSTLVINGWN